MKRNEGTFRHSRAPQAASRGPRQKPVGESIQLKTSEPSQRAQRRFEQSEERRRQRKERRRKSKTKSATSDP